MPKAVIHVLDPGAVKYGDSILCNIADRWFLIDGARSNSTKPTVGSVHGVKISHVPLQDQIAANRGGMHVDLLVITHCHSDHVGCLPELIADHGLTFDWALVADPQLGFGLGVGEELPDADRMSDEMKLQQALREEPMADGTDEEIAQFIADSASEYQAYKALLTAIQQQVGAQMVVYKGQSEAETPGITALLSEFSDVELRIHGPSLDQLLLCSDALEGRSTDAAPAIADAIRNVDAGDLVSAYRALIGSLSDATSDDPDGDNGNAVNCQSIILSFGAGGKKFLLTGDMQFAKTFLGDDVDEEVNGLLADIRANGPYHFVKLSHHGATNGQDEAIMRDWGAKLLAISTGSKSNQHPTKTTIEALKRLRTNGFKWARTDINGICTYTLSNSGAGSLKIARGTMNDITPPDARDSADDLEIATVPGGGPAVRVEAAGGRIVDVTIRVPYERTRVTVTIDIEPGVQPGGGGSTTPLP